MTLDQARAEKCIWERNPYVGWNCCDRRRERRQVCVVITYGVSHRVTTPLNAVWKYCPYCGKPIEFDTSLVDDDEPQQSP